MSAEELTDEERRILSRMEDQLRREGRLMRRLGRWVSAACRWMRRPPAGWLTALLGILAAGSLLLLVEAVRADSPTLIYTFVGTWTVTLVGLGSLVRGPAAASAPRPHRNWNRTNRNRTRIAPRRDAP
ncbi:hypothetical protein QMK19_04105 [Streptomyces sp. H10-C2]|uniref:hypothetical protein n=1 Tax=unclassified Streptomyces TaxID=2593676 RepID=UPI0024B9F4D9|nr:MULTISPECIES: hypothetical protein [unclassified Streptomyces]MDJ0343538.1 hypothetical protein [Streptomyces sp. PH10-H1]MDJ0368886.1 hypothetical protein [Streptomyces sp. H10-C2]